MRKGTGLVALVIIVSMMSGCVNTIRNAVKFRKMDTDHELSESVFLAPRQRGAVLVWLDVAQTGQYTLDLYELSQQIRRQGLVLTEDPELAHYRYRARVRYTGRGDTPEARSVLGSVIGGAATGAVLGSVMGGGQKTVIGAGLGGVVSGVGDVIGAELFKPVTYIVVTDIQLSERAPKGGTQTTTSVSKQGKSTTTTQQFSGETAWLNHQTRVVSSARKLNLSELEAMQVLSEGLIPVLSGLLPTMPLGAGRPGAGSVADTNNLKGQS